MAIRSHNFRAEGGVPVLSPAEPARCVLSAAIEAWPLQRRLAIDVSPSPK
jgi:hypothetical protein